MGEKVIIPDPDIHPAAELFPMLGEQELAELAEDIRQHGQRDRCVFYRGQLIDGRNRWKACELLGVEPECRDIDDDPDFDPVAYVLSVNLHRRHLSAAQKRGVIANVLEQHPEKSNRQVARETRVSHHTVAAVRDDLEATGQIARLDRTEGADGKSRPARRSTTRHVSEPPAALTAAEPETELKVTTDLSDPAINPAGWSPRMRTDAARMLRRFQAQCFKLAQNPRCEINQVLFNLIRSIEAVDEAEKVEA